MKIKVIILSIFIGLWLLAGCSQKRGAIQKLESRMGTLENTDTIVWSLQLYEGFRTDSVSFIYQDSFKTKKFEVISFGDDCTTTYCNCYYKNTNYYIQVYNDDKNLQYLPIGHKINEEIASVKVIINRDTFLFNHDFSVNKYLGVNYDRNKSKLTFYASVKPLVCY